MNKEAAPLSSSSTRREPSVLAWLRLMRVAQKIRQASEEQFREFGINTAQFDVLAHVGSAEGTTQQQVADALLVTKSNVCQLLDRMERSGLIERRSAGRANQLYLTPAGRSLYERAVPAHERMIADRFSALSASEQHQLLGILRTLDRALG
jgi:DNA-binding MarR family transcriptional regulator